MKRIVSLILALSMVLSMFSMSFAGTSLKDIEGTKYEAAVEALIELGVVNGYPDGTFLPNNVVTRAELAKLLVVAYGLEPAAEASKGATAFSDIGSEHWASGYINVSSDYKFVNGYPEGTFKGDATVTYAEAITMCLRVLGYANEIDSKGTWPTNYIAKAQDLKLMEDIDFGSYNDGAKRGDIALLIWNMLRTPMWEVTGETEGDGLESSPRRFMLNIKFADYAYAEDVTFVGFDIEEDSKEEVAKVMITLDCDCATAAECDHDFLGVDYEYAKNDFYTFVPGTEVEVLVNEEDGTLLTMVPTGDDKVVNGSKEAYEDNYGYNVKSGDDLTNVAYDYIYARVEKKDAVAYVLVNASSIYVDEIEIDEDDEEISINDEEDDGSVAYYDYQYSEIVLRDGERVEDGLAGLKVGEVFTTVTVAYDEEANVVGRFHVIGEPEEVEGEFKKYGTVEFEDSTAVYLQLTIDSDKYPVDADATYVEDPSEEDPTVEDLGTGLADMKGEEIVAKLDPLFGKVVRIEFDGEINGNDDEDTTFAFFGIDSIFGVDSSSKKGYSYVVDLVDDTNNTEEDVVVGKGTAAADLAKLYAGSYDNTMLGSFIVAEIDEDGEIIDIRVIADRSGEGENLEPVVYGESGENEFYTMTVYANAKFDEEDGIEYISGEQSGERVLVGDDTILVKVIFDDNGTEDDPTDDDHRVEFSDAVETVKDEKVIIVVDAKAEYPEAKYVVVWDDLSDNSGNRISVLADSNEKDTYVGGDIIDLKDEDDSLVIADGTPTLTDYELFVYSVIERENGDDKFKFIAGLTTADLTSGEDQRSNYVYCVSSNGKLFKLDNTDSEYKNFTTLLEDCEGYMFVLVDVEEDKDNKGTFLVEKYKEIDADEVADSFKPSVSSNGTLTDKDTTVHTRYIVDGDAEVVFIINGMFKK